MLVRQAQPDPNYRGYLDATPLITAAANDFNHYLAAHVFAPGARQMLRRCSPLSSGRLAELRCMLGSPVGSPARGVFLFSGRKSSARHVLRRLCSPRLSSGRLAEHHCRICSLVDLWHRLGFFCASSCYHCLSLIQSPRLLQARELSRRSFHVKARRALVWQLHPRMALHLAECRHLPAAW